MYLNTSPIIDKGKSAITPPQPKRMKSALISRESMKQRSTGNGKQVKSRPDNFSLEMKVNSKKSSKQQRSVSPKLKMWNNFFSLPDSEHHKKTQNSVSFEKSQSLQKVLSDSDQSSVSANTDPEDSGPEPIGELILCTFCREKFYDPKYLAWHVHHEHTNDDSDYPLSNNNSAQGGGGSTSTGNQLKIRVPPKIVSPKKTWTDAVKPKLLKPKNSSSSSSLQNQTRQGHSSSSSEYKCLVCSKIFSNQKNLTRHVSMHQGQKVLSCKICPQRCLNIQQLREHQLKFHSDFYVFSIAGTMTEAPRGKNPTTPTPRRINGNGKTNSIKRKRKKFEADSEDDEDDDSVKPKPKAIPSNSEIRSNSIKVGSAVSDNAITKNEALNNSSDSLGDYHCPFCQFVTRSRTEDLLREHVRNKHHGKGSPFTGNSTCKYCNYKAKYPLDILRHIRSHDEEKVFSCKFCSKRFREYTMKKSHEMKHTSNEETFPCPHCDKFYFHGQSLTRHMAEFHPL